MSKSTGHASRRDRHAVAQGEVEDAGDREEHPEAHDDHADRPPAGALLLGGFGDRSAGHRHTGPSHTAADGHRGRDLRQRDTTDQRQRARAGNRGEALVRDDADRVLATSRFARGATQDLATGQLPVAVRLDLIVHEEADRAAACDRVHRLVEVSGDRDRVEVLAADDVTSEAVAARRLGQCPIRGERLEGPVREDRHHGDDLGREHHDGDDHQRQRVNVARASPRARPCVRTGWRHRQPDTREEEQEGLARVVRPVG